MKRERDGRGWNPYVAGALTGLLLIFSAWFAGKYVGASTTFVRTAGFIEKMVSAERVGKMEYFVREAPKIDWQWMFVAGIFVGSLVSALTSGSFKWQALPSRWEGRFGSGRGKRAITAFAGGMIAMFGARLADG